jgi:hypothetical protein
MTRKFNLLLRMPLKLVYSFLYTHQTRETLDFDFGSPDIDHPSHETSLGL